MDSSLLASPVGAPLSQKSPERVNRQPILSGSPLKDPFVASSPSTDVQGKVAQFNNLSREATQKRKENEAALRRAVLGREEAESETRRLKEDNKVLQDRLDEVRERDQRIAKKFEAYGEEKRKLIDHQHKVQKISEQEVRRARKEAFKFSSALVTAQEDLQRARGHLEELREQANVERSRGKRYQQEAFDAQSALSTVEEELEALRRRLKSAEDERDALRLNLNEEQVARIAAEGRLPLPPAADPEDEFASPRKSKARRISARRESLKENMDPSWKQSNDIFDIMWAAEEGDEFAIAKRNLWVEEKRRQEAEMMIQYLKVEYEQKPCSCLRHGQSAVEAAKSSDSKKPREACSLHTAEGIASPILETSAFESARDEEATIVHYSRQDDSPCDDNFGLPSPSTQSEPACLDAHEVGRPLALASEPRVEPPSFTIHEDDAQTPPVPEVTPEPELPRKAALVSVAPSRSPSLLVLEADKENISDTAETSIISIRSEDIDTDSSAIYSGTPQAVTEPVKPAAHRAVTPVYRSQTTTTTVPLRSGESPVKKNDYPFSPGATMTREEALEAIKQRRGRARSVHDSTTAPRKADLMRNISSKSAPAL